MPNFRTQKNSELTYQIQDMELLVPLDDADNQIAHHFQTSLKKYFFHDASHILHLQAYILQAYTDHELIQVLPFMHSSLPWFVCISFDTRSQTLDQEKLHVR